MSISGGILAYTVNGKFQGLSYYVYIIPSPGPCKNSEGKKKNKIINTENMCTVSGKNNN
jgi:hypothetical protein